MPLDESALSNAETSVTVARSTLIEIPEMPKEADAINTAAESLAAMNHSGTIKDLSEKHAALEDSIAQLSQVTNPPEAFVVERL